MRNDGSYLKLREEIVLFPVEGGVLIDGCAKLELLKGILSETLLPTLLEKLDGTRSISELKDELGDIPGSYVEQAIDFLSSRNLLDDECLIETDLPSPARAFLQRYDLAIKWGQFGADPRTRSVSAARRLEHATVELSVISGAENWFAVPLAEQLTASGIKHNTISTYQPEFNNIGHLARLLLSHGEKGSNCTPNHIVMYVGVGDQSSTIRFGPIIRSKTDGCPECCDRAFVACSPARGSELAVNRRLAVSLCSWEVIDVLLTSPHALGGSRIREYDLETLAPRTRHFPCHQLAVPKSGRKAALHDLKSIQFDSASIYNDRISNEQIDQGLGHRLQVAGASRGASEFAVARRCDLPRTECNFSASASHLFFLKSRPKAKAMGLIALAEICAFGSGIREVGSSAVRRWVPSGGNLGSVRLHVLTMGMDGLEEGLYTYDPITHSLVNRRSRRSLATRELLQTLCGCRIQQQQTMFILTGQQDVLAPKYGDFSYKLCNLDTGVIVAQIGLVATALGVQCELLHCWPDDLLANELNLRQGAAAATALIELGRVTSHFLQRRRQPFYGSSKSIHDPEYFRDLSMSDLTRCIIEEGAFRASDHVATDIRKQPKIRPDAATLIELPGPTISTASVGSILDARKSVREFSRHPVKMADLNALLRAAWINDQKEWKHAHKLGICLKFSILFRTTVDGVFSMFRYIPDYHALTTLHDVVTEESIEEMFIQHDFLQAPVSIFISANIGEAVLHFGLSAYRGLLLRAGAAGHRMWLTGLTMGLEGTLVAGLRMGGVRAQIEMAGECESPLLACSLGNGTSL